MPLLNPHTTELVRSAHRDYHLKVALAYDEVLHEISDRAASRGSLGKADIGALLFWKRLRAETPWAAQLSSMPDVAVRKITGPAVAAVQDLAVPAPDAARRGRAILSSLPGFRSGETSWLPPCWLLGLPSAWLSTTAEPRRLSARSDSSSRPLPDATVGTWP